MKNKTQITFILAIVLVAITLTSCNKEYLTPTEIEAAKLEKDNALISEQGNWKSDQNSILSSLNNITVDINITACPTGGVSVTATSVDADLSSAQYTVNWYKNTEQTIYFEGLTLDCVCQFGVRVEVLDSEGNIVGENSIDLPAC